MATNQELLQERADVAASILQTPGGGGSLPPEKTKEFFRILQNSTSLLSEVRMEPMNALTKNVPKIGFGAVNVLSVAPDATNTGDLPLMESAVRSAPSLSEIQLNAKPYMAIVKLGLQVLKNNVEKDQFENTLMEEMTKAVGNKIEVLGLASDTAIPAGGEARLAINKQDGWIKRITSNVVDNADAALSESLLTTLKLSVPRRFRQGQHKFWTEDGAAEHWRSILGSRATPGGDTWLTKGEIPPALGVPITVVQNMPVAAAVAGPPSHPERSTILFTDPKNLILGTFQEIEVHIEPVYREGSIYITVFWQNAFAVMHEQAAAKATNVLANPASLL